ncbi:LacI family DNA-binding transcriptional regulator [Luteolibacter arcticus]|uniref:LacI family DNA-binding transcriptional regulator n=1 Tax=Luteolibacter arcticus TaxID=1581411 RepID=A0ABT3GC76_9BACT|nr:LacI family DNA-binding transcriptional regulator [Luteolibacter arcticus]MCW1921220.1 LacI family DNA-binding transcriptional regulator [Luteolibacter arcticus]
MIGTLDETIREPVSQRDIARHFGVSHVTVSLALRHSRRVSASLAEEIRNHAEKVGYCRDPVLLALSAYRDRKKAGPVRGAIGWVNAWAEPGELRAHPEVERFWQGAFAAAAERRYRLEEFRLGSELSAERLHEVLDTRCIRGLIVPPHPSSQAWLGFPWESYDVVSFGRCCEGPRGHSAMPSAVANLLLAIRKLREAGHRRIGCLTGRSLLRQAGYCMVESLPAVKRNLPDDDDLALLDLASVSESKVAAKVRAWVRLHGLDAIVADDAATIASVRQAGFAVPDQVAMVTLAGGGSPGIDPGSEEIGRTAVQMLDSLMQERARGSRVFFREVAVEGTWRG